MTEIFHQIYIIEPLWLAAAIGAALILLWGVIARTARKMDGAYKAVRIVSYIGFAAALFIILWKTIFCRSVDLGCQVILVPFNKLQRANTNSEYIRMLLMNVLLFVPLGMMGPFVFEKTNHPMLITIIAGFLLSVAIEFVQYYFKLGVTETDDVIMNTLGAAIGTLSWKFGGRHA